MTDFLDTLAKATNQDVDVVLADNGSTDGSVQAMARRAGVQIVDTGGNIGYGRAANAGVRETSAEFVVVANPDIEWEPGSLDQLLAAARRWPKGASFGPLIHTPEGDIYPSARSLPALGRGIGHALFGWWWPSNPWTAAYRVERQPPVERTAGWLSGSCLLLRRDAFDEVGGFDPGYFMYFEDLDLGDRLGAAGWHNVYVPSAVVCHTGGHATSVTRRGWRPSTTAAPGATCRGATRAGGGCPCGWRCASASACGPRWPPGFLGSRPARRPSGARRSLGLAKGMR